MKEIPALLKKSIVEKSTLGTTQPEDNKLAALDVERINDNLSEVNSSLTELNTAIKDMHASLLNLLSYESKSAYDKEEAAMEAKPATVDKKEKVAVKEEGPGFFGILKSLFTNPVVAAALAGALYTLLPEDTKKRIKAILKGFTEGITEVTGDKDNGFSGLSTALKVVGVGLATFFGAKLLKSVLDAVTTTVKLIKSVGRMGKGGKLAVAAAVGYGAVKLGQALVKDESDKEEKEEKEEGDEKVTEEKEVDEKVVEKEVTGGEKTQEVKQSQETSTSTSSSSSMEGATIQAPEATTQAPGAKAPGATIQAPEATTQAPGAKAPGATIQAPEATTQAPGAKAPEATPVEKASPVSSKESGMGGAQPSMQTGKPSTSSSLESGAGSGTGITPGASIGFKSSTGGGFKGVKDMIKKHEGVKTRPYKDSLGLWTVGVGHLIGDGKTLPPEYNREFSIDEVNNIFDKDFEHHQKAAEKIPGYDKLNETGKGALIDLTFNMGPAWYKKWPNFTKQLEAGNVEGAASNLESSKWYGQVGRRGPEIVSMIRQGAGPQQEKKGSILSTPLNEPIAMIPGEEEMDTSGGQEQGAMVSSKPAATSNPATVSEVTESGGFDWAKFKTPKEKAALEKSRGRGEDISSMSEQNEAAASTKAAAPIINNNTKDTTQKIGKSGAKDADVIPSPIANRGSLGYGTRHASYY